MSKLDYLKKYGLSTNTSKDGEDTKKTKRIFSKTRGNFQVIDEDASWTKSAKGKSSIGDDRWSSFHDDVPVIVDSKEVSNTRLHEPPKQGSWEEVAITNGSKNSNEDIDDDDDDEVLVTRRPRHDSDDDDDILRPRKPQRSRNDSDDESDEARVPRRPPGTSTSRQDNDDDDEAHVPRRPRHDSDDDEAHVLRRPRHSDDGDRPAAPETSERKKTSSGHFAGLQSGASFGEKEKILKAERDKELANFDKQLSGVNAETVYRDKSGKKVDMVEDFMKKQAIEEGKKAKIAQAQKEWSRGTVQKELAIQTRLEHEEIAAEPFARTVEDPKLEASRREVLRDGDPMAEYFVKKQVKRSPVDGENQGTRTSGKPVYKGPSAPPNRFHILPGYRWDGIHRGNDFEKTLLLRVNEKKSSREDEYKWSVSDM